MTTWATAFPQNNGAITTNATIIGPFDVTPFSNAVIGFSGTYAGITVNFEGSVDGTTWFPVNAAPTAGGTVANGSVTLPSNATTAFDVLLGPFTGFRVRSSAFTSGSATVAISLGNAIYDPAPSTITAGDVASGTTDSGNPVKVGGIGFTNPNGQTVTNGQRATLAMDLNGAPFVVIKGNGAGNAASVLNTITDSLSGGNASLVVSSFSMGYNGSSWDRQRVPTKFTPLTSTAIGTETTIWTPAAGKKFRLMSLIITASAAVSIVLKDNTAGTTIFQVPTLVVGTPTTIRLDGNGILSAAANNLLTATASGAANIIGTIIGTEE